MAASSGRLRGKVVVVTGGASGMGRAGAALMAAEGAHVIVADLDDERSQAVAQSIVAAGGEAHAVHVDVRSVDSVQRLVEAALQSLRSPIDVLYHNAIDVRLDALNSVFLLLARSLLVRERAGAQSRPSGRDRHPHHRRQAGRPRPAPRRGDPRRVGPRGGEAARQGQADRPRADRPAARRGLVRRDRRAGPAPQHGLRAARSGARTATASSPATAPSTAGRCACSRRTSPCSAAASARCTARRSARSWTSRSAPAARSSASTRAPAPASRRVWSRSASTARSSAATCTRPASYRRSR